MIELIIGLAFLWLVLAIFVGIFGYRQRKTLRYIDKQIDSCTTCGVIEKISSTKDENILLGSKTEAIQRQLNCIAEGGHFYKYVSPCAATGFGEADRERVMSSAEVAFGNCFPAYIYCCPCGHEKMYKWEELPEDEQEALKTLGVVGDTE